jgi:hypothetical protein
MSKDWGTKCLRIFGMLVLSEVRVAHALVFFLVFFFIFLPLLVFLLFFASDENFPYPIRHLNFQKIVEK